MIKKSLLFLVFLFFLNGMALSQPNCVTVGDWPAGRSEEDLKTALRYIKQKDRIAFNKLLTSGRVVMLKEGLQVYVEEQKGIKIKIRPYGHTLTAWTLKDAVECE